MGRRAPRASRTSRTASSPATTPTRPATSPTRSRTRRSEFDYIASERDGPFACCAKQKLSSINFTREGGEDKSTIKGVYIMTGGTFLVTPFFFLPTDPWIDDVYNEAYEHAKIKQRFLQ